MSGRRAGKKPASRVSLISWFNRRFGAKPPFTDPLGEKGPWTRFARAPAHRVVHYRVPLKGVGAEPWRVVLLADPHLGGHAGDIDRMRGIVAETNALSPDLVLLLGDYVNMMPFGRGRIAPEAIARVFRPLEAPAGVYAILGNHDWRYGREVIAEVFEAVGIPLIDNSIAIAERGADRLALLGLEDEGWGEPDLTLFEHLPAGLPALVATHDPGLFHDIPPGHVVVAGHMHGGQIRWPTLPPPAIPTGRAPRRWAHGHIRERGSDLIVSAGLGVSGLPLRLGIPPELVVLELVSP